MAKGKDYDKLELPEDERGNILPILFGQGALAVTYDASVSADTEVALNADTSLVEITALSQPVFVKFKTSTGGTAVSSSNFDVIILANSTRQFAPASDVTHISVIEQTAGAVVAISEF